MKLSKKQKTVLLAVALLTAIILFFLSLYPNPPKVDEGSEIKLNDTDKEIKVTDMIYPSENKVVSSRDNTTLPISDDIVQDTTLNVPQKESEEDASLKKLQDEIRNGSQHVDLTPDTVVRVVKKKKKVKKEKKVPVEQQTNVQPKSLFNTVALNKEKKFNAIKAFVHSTQTVMVGSTLKMRLAEDAYTDDNIKISKNSPVYGLVDKIDGERVIVKITHVNVNGNILPFKKEVFSKDALPGIYVPGNEKSEAKNAVTEGAVQAVELPTTSGIPAIDAAGAITGNVVNATKQVIKKNIERIKVTIKTNYQIFLMTPKEEKMRNNLKKQIKEEEDEDEED